jgi:hypothetical protein
MRLLHVFFCSVVALDAVPASAGVIPDLFNTGVGSNRLSLSDGTSPDPHYTIISSSDGSVASPTTVKTSASGFPIGYWIGDSSSSAWVIPSGGYPGRSLPGGYYDYQTTFTLPAGVAAVTISANIACDDQGLGILLNGQSVGAPRYDVYVFYTPVTFTSDDVVAGMNTLTFLTGNAYTSPTGLRIDGITGAYTTVPEPCSLLAMLTLASLQLSKRQRVGPTALATV